MGQDSDPAAMGRPTSWGVLCGAGGAPMGPTLTQWSTRGCYGAGPFCAPLGSRWGVWSTRPTPHPTGVPMGRGGFFGVFGHPPEQALGAQPHHVAAQPPHGRRHPQPPHQVLGPGARQRHRHARHLVPAPRPGGLPLPPKRHRLRFWGQKMYIFFLGAPSTRRGFLGFFGLTFGGSQRWPGPKATSGVWGGSAPKKPSVSTAVPSSASTSSTGRDRPRASAACPGGQLQGREGSYGVSGAVIMVSGVVMR